jgi:plasmid stability protein
MAQLLIRKLDDDAKERLKARAKKHGRSLEAEARAILEDAANGTPAKRSAKEEKGLGTRIAERFKGIGFTEDERRRFDRTIEAMWRNNPPRFVEFDK